MPYRRLPNTDQARLRALRTVIQKEEKLGFDSRFISFKTVIDAKNFLTVFEKQQLHYRQALENQINANKRYQQIIYNARLYISHFIQVFNLSVIRGDIKKEHKLFYQLDPEIHNVPDLSTENDLLHWGKCIIDGENERIRNGGLPIYNPAIAKVKVHYEIFKEYKYTQKIHQQATTRQWEELVQLRITGDKIIKDLWDEIEAHFQDLHPYYKLERCKEYGVVYYYRKGEPEITKPSDSE
ncbi:MAG TPA: hypothetical protein PLO29_02255 [Paludibacter sp.]|jgi:hypothetical protein|nr:MAG: hypothetical protein BWY08_02093 [Bacteroidetes bacterium ADurb.Bin174]HQB27749.1 hypothetical protein [Paludibacter sp.]